METITLNATKRNILGKKTKDLRVQGKLPAVVYGHNTDTESIELDAKEFGKAFKQAGESTLVSLNIEGEKKPVLIQEVQHHYLNGNPIHVDFYAVNMTEKLKARIPIYILGESPAVKALGGVMVKNLSEVEVECLPGDLPQFIEVDIATLTNFEDAIRVSDLRVSDKVKILASPDEMIVTVTAPRSDEELKALDETVTEDVTKVEGVIKPEAGEVKAEDEAKPVKAAKEEKES